MTTVPARTFSLALVPIRLFFGATFLVAGLDKLLDPAFLDVASPASIYAQLAAFERFSPLAGLIHWSAGYAGIIGVLIAVGEIGIGIGALTGLAFRVAAAGGVALSLLFWLTASWATTPYYFGADLPYAAGWAVLAIAGHGGMLMPHRRSRGLALERPGPIAAPSVTRRVAMETLLLGAAAVVVASAAGSLRSLAFRDPTGGMPSPGPATSPPPAGGLTIATINSLEERRAIPFTVPFDAPSPLPAGDPGIIIQLPDGRFVAYDLICTHAACTVGWDPASSLLACPCHGATYDPADAARVLSGPTVRPLASLPLVVDPATGTIRLAAVEG